MILWSKRNDPGVELFTLKKNDGNALPVVLLFSVIGLIIIFTYISNQLLIAKPTFRSSTSVQALFNARSGIYKAFDMIVNDSTPDTLKTINTLDKNFSDQIPDSSNENGPFNETPADLNLYKDESFGKSQITLIPKGSFYELTSIGLFRDSKRTVYAQLGGKIPALPDTVLLIYNNLPWTGTEPRGTRASMSQVDTTSKSSKLLESLLKDYAQALQVFDTALLNPPLSIQSERDLAKLKDTINGSLLLDGSFSEVVLKGKRTMYILGDLQITGEFSTEDVSFVVAGEIKILDKSKIKRASMYTQNRIFIGDNAQFSGDAIALNSIVIYNNASVTDKSSLVVVGQSSVSKDSTKDSTATKSKQDSLKYAIQIADKASVDAVCIALGTPGAIKTEQETKILGILWAKNNICHQGTMSGLIRAGKMIDCTVEDSSNPPVSDTSGKNPAAGSNTMTGKLEPLKNIRDYRMPCFTGELSIIGWKEE